MLLPTRLFLIVGEILIVLIFLILIGYYFYYQFCFTYWKKRGVPSSNPRFPFGDLSSAVLGRESVFVRLAKLYNTFKANGFDHGGIYFFNGPIYLPINPDLVKRILLTDFDHFIDRGMYENEKELPLSSHIFSMEGDQWKRVRAKFSPTFTAGKMKSIYNILLQNCENLTTTLQPLAATRSVVDIKEILMRFTADIIGSTAFGIDSNSLKYPDSQFSQMVQRISNHSSWKLLRVALEEGLQNPGNIEKIAYSDKTVEDFFTDLVVKTMEYRDKNKVVREDFLNILMQMRTSAGISTKEIVAQSFLFFIAGFKTSSLTMSYCLHELAHHQEIQDSVREEILENLGRDSSKFKYDDVMRLPLLDRVLKETMRKYPPLPMLNRICVKPYHVPGTDVVLEKGTLVIIPLLGLHRDPLYFPEPLKFDPERFNEDVNKVVPFTYLPFGDGPRNCIGLRFGNMQLKLGIASLLSSFRFVPSWKTPRDLEIDPSTTSILFNVANGVYTKILPL